MKKNLMIILSALFCLCIISGIGKGFGEVLISEVISANIQVQGDYLFWSDDTETPINKIPVTGGPITPLAMKMGDPVDFAIQGADIFWVESRRGTSPSGCIGEMVWIILNRTSLDGTSNTALAEGDACYGGGALLLDEQNVYWVNSIFTPPTYTIEKVPISGGDSITLVSSTLPITKMKHDATHLYWLEAHYPDGATIKRIPLGGGEATVLYSVPENAGHGIPDFLIHDTEIVLIHSGWPEASSIVKIPISGGSVTTLADLPNTPRKMVIYGEYVYWIDDSTIKKIPLSGGGIVTLATWLNSPGDISIDSENIIFTETDAIKKIPTTGGDIIILATGLNSPFNLVVDSENAIWVEVTMPGARKQNTSIKKVPITGGAVSILAEGASSPGGLVPHNSDLYWTEGGPYASIEGFGRIAKVPIGGGTVTSVISGVSSSFPNFAVNNEDIYIVDKWTIKKTGINGGRPLDILFSADDGVADLATDGIHVYWIEGPFSIIRRIPVNGGEVETLAPNTGTSGPPGPIKLDSTHVYWMDHDDTIKKIPKIGGPVMTIASGLPFLSDFVVDGTNVYFSENDTGNIRRVSVEGGTITTLANGLMASWNILTLDNLNVYWIDQVHIGKVPKTGGTVTYIVPGGLVSDPYIPNAIAVDNTSIYWTETFEGTINRIAKEPQPPSITLTAPNGGETWACGTTQTISWTYRGSPGSNVKIELLKGGSLNRTISGMRSIGSGGSGSYSWIVPSTQSGGSDYQIRLTSTTNGSYTDTSDGNFTITGPPPPSITVSSPNGGERWPAGSAQTIHWSYTGNPGTYLKIELLKAGVVNRTIVSAVSKGVGGSGSRNWTIPANQVPGTDYRIRVTSTSNGVYTDISDSDFAIAAPTITVASPNGGETWPAGSTQKIRWSYSGNPGAYVKVELLKGGAVSRMIASFVSKGTGGVGSRNWTIPANQVPGTDYTIRVTSTTTVAYTDTSDSDFTIE